MRNFLIAFAAISLLSASAMAQQTTDKNRQDIRDTSKAMGGDRVKSTEGGTSSSKSSSEGRLGDHTTKPRAGK